MFNIQVHFLPLCLDLSQQKHLEIVEPLEMYLYTTGSFGFTVCLAYIPSLSDKRAHFSFGESFYAS